MAGGKQIDPEVAAAIFEYYEHLEDTPQPIPPNETADPKLNFQNIIAEKERAKREADGQA